MSSPPKRSRKRTVAVLLLIGILVLVLVELFNSGALPSVTTGNSTATTGSSGPSFTFLTLPNKTVATTNNTVNPSTNPSNPFGGGLVGQNTPAGLSQALKGQSGFSAFLSARECGLVINTQILFCDSFPGNSLDPGKWNSYGAVTVSPGQVSFSNGTIITKGGFYYGKFATFTIQVNPQPPITTTGPCPRGWFRGEDVHGRLVCIDYAVWGFAKGTDANNIQTGIYWEQLGDQIRSHTRAQDPWTHAYIDSVSQWQPAPAGTVDFGINWSVDLQKGGAYAQFIYYVHDSNQLVYFSEHTGPSVPQLTILYLFAAASGTVFVIHRVVILPAWVNGTIPFVNLP